MGVRNFFREQKRRNVYIGRDRLRGRSRGKHRSKQRRRYFLIVISTRRFFCRPSGLSEPSGRVFSATGFSAPQPRVRMPASLMPFVTNQDLTEAARFSESFALYDADPFPSVCPSINTFAFGCF